MFTLAACLLLVTGTLAVNYNMSSNSDWRRYRQPYQQTKQLSNQQPKQQSNLQLNNKLHPNPIDYNADYEVRPNYNFFYSFEQARKDQPSQIDTREESMDRYRYMPRLSTTPGPLAKFYDYDSNNMVNKNSMSSTTMPALPPPPYIEEFDWSQMLRSQDNAQYNQKPSEYYKNREFSIKSTEDPVAQDYLSKENSQYKPIDNYYPVLTASSPIVQWQDYPEYVQATTMSPGWNIIGPLVNHPAASHNRGTNNRGINNRRSHNRVSQKIVTNNKKSQNRGSYKFNWKDLPSAAVAAEVSTMTPSMKRKSPPPAVPTLTPWSGDRF